MSNKNNDHIRKDFVLNIDNKEYRLGQLNAKDLNELQTYLQRIEPIESLQDVLKNSDLDEDTKKQLKTEAINDGKCRKLGSPEFDNALQTINGLMYTLYLSLRVNHKTVTRQWVTDNLTNEKIEEIESEFNNIMGVDALDVNEDKDDDDKKKQVSS